MNVWSVSEITKYIKNGMESDAKLRNTLVRGEISNFKRHYSGHCYFTLKDAGAAVKCVMFKSKAQYLKFQPENGMKAVVGGAVTVFERDGAYQLYAHSILPEGTGELSAAFEQLKEKLLKEGLFDAAHKQPLPFFPRRIGVVTSAAGAVLRDIYTVSKRRNPGISLRLYPVQVQGADASGQIAAAIRFFNEKYPVDLLIIGRGGGSMEDLWAFNEEATVRAVFASKIPVVSAVGHETDYTLADFAADVRAATPSQAAELAVPDIWELRRRICLLRAHLNSQARRIFREKAGRLEVCRKNKAFAQPQWLLGQKRQLADYWRERLEQEKKRRMLDKKHQLAVLLEKLQLLNPVEVLSRGYGLVKTDDAVIQSVGQVKEGQAVEVFLKDGWFAAAVGKIRKERVENGLFKNK